MAVPSEIRQILHEIRLVRSPVGRMKLLARAWKSFGRLKPWERRRLAARLGLQEFESILEGMASRQGGMVPDEIVDALDGVGEVDPSRIGEIVRQLRDPRQRRDLARRGLERFRDHLAGPAEDVAGAAAAAATSATPPPETDLPEPAPAPAAPGEAGRERQEPEPAAPAMTAATGTPAPEAGAASATTAAAGVAAAASLSAGTIPHEVEPVQLPRRDVESAGAETGSGKTPDRPARTPVPHPEPPPAIPPKPPARGIAGIAAEERLSRKFRLFRDLLEEGEDLPLSAIRKLLAAFPEGWPRRRVLAALLGEDLPERFEEALELILELPSATDRRWCAAALLRSRDLTEEEAGLLAEAFPSPAMQRRIAALAR